MKQGEGRRETAKKENRANSTSLEQHFFFKYPSRLFHSTLVPAEAKLLKGSRQIGMAEIKQVKFIPEEDTVQLHNLEFDYLEIQQQLLL